MLRSILIVNSYYYPDIKGGAEVSTKLLAESLTELFENVYVLTTGNQKKDIIREKINGVNVIRIPIKNLYWPGEVKERNIISKIIWHLINNNNLLINRLISEIIKEINPLIINTQNLMGIGTSLWSIASKFSIPVVHTTRDYALIKPVNSKVLSSYLQRTNKKRSKNVNYLVGISNYIIEEHKNWGFFPGKSYISIHNVVNTPVYLKRIRKQGEPLVLGFYGQLEENKGLEILINAIAELPYEVVGELNICGEGSLKQKILELSKIDKRIKFQGKLPINEVYQKMAASDLTVVPSKWAEPFGRVIIESYRQGTQVIGSDVGGIPEIITNKKQYLFSNEDTSALKQKITNYYSLSEKEKISESKKAYNIAEKYLENTSLYMEVYDKVLKQYDFSPKGVKKIENI